MYSRSKDWRETHSYFIFLLLICSYPLSLGGKSLYLEPILVLVELGLLVGGGVLVLLVLGHKTM